MSKRTADAASLDNSDDNVSLNNADDNISVSDAGEEVSLSFLVQRHTTEYRKMTKEKIVKLSTQRYHIKREIATKEHELRILNGKLKRTERRLMESCQQQHIIEYADEEVLKQNAQTIVNDNDESNKQNEGQNDT